jgi:tripartite-type tricarboxylate transporter receptor subunit TctC
MRLGLWRRTFLAILLIAATAQETATAQSYPEHPVRLIVGLAAGGPTDSIARIVGRRLSERLGQSVVVENKAGASGVIAAQSVMNAPADGYTLLWASASLPLLPITAPAANFSPDRDLLPVAAAAVAPSILLVSASSAYKTFADLASAIKAAPGRLNFGSPGVGTSSHLAGAVMMHAGGMPAVHVPYKGNAPVVQDLLAGHIDFMYDSTITAMPLIESHKLRPLAVTTLKRSAFLPDTPTLDECGIAGFEMLPWHGIFAPKGTPSAVVKRLEDDLQQVLANPAVVEELAARGVEPYYLNSKDMQTLVGRETVMWRTKLQEMGLNLAQ